MPLDDWLTSEEAKKISGYDIQHIRRLARSGKIRAQKFGNQWMISRRSLQEYLENEGRSPKKRVT